MFLLFFFAYSGASSFGSVFRSTEDSECHNVLELAVKSGVNLIDVAPWYGHGKAENVLGKVNLGLMCMTDIFFRKDHGENFNSSLAEHDMPCLSKL